MKELLERLGAALNKLRERIDPHAAAHEMHVIESAAHDLYERILGDMHSEIETLRSRVADLEKLLRPENSNTPINIIGPGDVVKGTSAADHPDAVKQTQTADPGVIG